MASFKEFQAMRRGDANAAAASRVLAATHLEVPSYAQAYEPPSPALREAQGRLRDLERRRGRCLTSCACRLAPDPPPAAAPPLVSVVCATMGSRAAFHGALLECFRRQTWPAKELIVYDTGGAPSPTLRDAGDARYVHAPTHVTLGAKRRLLLGLARGKVVAHFDDDNVYGPDYLATMVPHCAAAELGKKKRRQETLPEKRVALRRRRRGPREPLGLDELPRLRGAGVLAAPAIVERFFSAGSGTLERVDFKAATGRAETFVHGANVDVPFPPLDRGEDGCAAQLVSHDVDDDAGLFLHVEHGANTAPARGDRRADVADLAAGTAALLADVAPSLRRARQAARRRSAR